MISLTVHTDYPDCIILISGIRFDCMPAPGARLHTVLMLILTVHTNNPDRRRESCPQSEFWLQTGVPAPGARLNRLIILILHDSIDCLS